jgi:DNA-binding NarL/FixJ family response regulator
MIRVLVADDQALVREGLKMIVDAQDDMEVVAEAADGAEAVARAEESHPDIALMDVRMPQMDGIKATKLITRDPTLKTKVLVLTTFDLDEYVYEAVKAGASGFLLKDVGPNQLVAGIRVIAEGEMLLAPAITRRLVERFVRRPTPAGSTTLLGALTPRELEILKLVARGLSNTEIAQKLFLSPTTVKTHTTRILTKLHLRDRVQAVVLAYETGLVEPASPPSEIGSA